MPVQIHLELNSQGQVIPRSDANTNNSRTKVPRGESVTFHIPPGSKGGSISFAASPFGGPSPHNFDYASQDIHKVPLSAATSAVFVYSCVITDANGVPHTTGGGEIEVGN
jgi:hypothetical protein